MALYGSISSGDGMHTNTYLCRVCQVMMTLECQDITLERPDITIYHENMHLNVMTI